MPEIDTIRCPSCGATNRLPSTELGPGRKAVCGRCKTPLPVAVRPQTLTDATFAAEVEHSPLPVLVDMWAPWCGPCHMLAPTIDQLATELAGRVKVMKLDVDENPLTSSRFNARSIPLLLLFADGREVDRIVGVRPKSEIVARLERLVAR